MIFIVFYRKWSGGTKRFFGVQNVDRPIGSVAASCLAFCAIKLELAGKDASDSSDNTTAAE